MANPDGIAVPQHHSNGEGKNCFFPSSPPYRRSHAQQIPSLPLPHKLPLFRLIRPSPRFRHIWNISVFILRQSRSPCDAYHLSLPYPSVGGRFLFLILCLGQQHITPSFLPSFLSSFLPSFLETSIRQVPRGEGKGGAGDLQVTWM